MTQFRGIPRSDGQFRQLFAVAESRSPDFEAGLMVHDLTNRRMITLTVGDREFVGVAIQSPVADRPEPGFTVEPAPRMVVVAGKCPD